MSYAPGATAHIVGNFSDNIDGDPINPLNLKLHVTDPELVVTTYEYPGTIVKVANGDFYCNHPLPFSGDWHYRWDADDMACKDRLMHVERSRVLEAMAA